MMAAHPVTSQAGLLEQSQARETEATEQTARAPHPAPVVAVARQTMQEQRALVATAVHRAAQGAVRALVSMTTPQETAAQAHAVRYGLWNTKMTRLPEHLPSV
jgi:hypothetical protein